MESPVVLDKPPEYHGNERGFPFDEEEGSGAWSELAARHPDIAARLRQRPATWARKRRPSSQDGIDDTADSFGGFDRFPFDDIPPEFREHFPSHWNRRFGSRDEQFQQPPSPQPQSPQQQTAATQTEYDAGPSHEQATLPQYGLRNTVDLGQKSPADPSVVDADERSQRSMSAPPDHRTVNPNCNKMSGQNHQEQQQPQQQSEQHSNVRHIPIFVEGRDEPVINRSVDHGTHFADPKPTYVPPPPQPHMDREQYFADDGPVGFPFSKNFDRPFFRQSPQPFTKQKMYPQTFARGGSPQRSQSPKPQSYHTEHTVPRTETPSRPQQKQPPQQQKQTPPQQKQPPPHQKQPSPQQRQPTPQPTSPQPPQHEQSPPQQSPPPQQQTPSNDPVKQILTIQADVLNLMTEVEKFKGTKKDKHYLYLDEMLTRNLIKLDNVETDGKESIRQERKEVIKCIQKCIAVLEAKAENRALTTPPPQDVEMGNAATDKTADEAKTVQNGDVEMKETTKEEEKTESPVEQEQTQTNTTVLPEVQTETEMKEEANPEEIKKEEAQPVENKEIAQVQSDVQPEETKPLEPTLEVVTDTQTAQENVEKKQNPKKTGKKRDKSKDKKEVPKESKKDSVNKNEESKDDNKANVDKKEAIENDVNQEVNENEKENVDNKEEKVEVMQVDAKGDSNKPDSQAMDVDGAASQ